MAFHLEHLETVRSLSLAEAESDHNTVSEYYGRRLTTKGHADWPTIFRKALESGNAETLASDLRSGGRLKLTEGVISESCGWRRAIQAAFFSPSTNTMPSNTSCSFSLLFNLRQPFSALRASLKTIARAASREPAPLVR